MARCHCTACGQTFGGLTGFDRHLMKMAPDGRHGGCRRGSDCGLRKREDGVWVGQAPPQAHTERALTGTVGRPTLVKAHRAPLVSAVGRPLGEGYGLSPYPLRVRFPSGPQGKGAS